MAEMLPYTSSLNRARLFACELDASKFKSTRWVIIQHEDPAVYVFRHAFLKNDPKDKEYLWVFTEHQGVHVFAKNELSIYCELEQVKKAPFGGNG